MDSTITPASNKLKQTGNTPKPMDSTLKPADNTKPMDSELSQTDSAAKQNSRAFIFLTAGLLTGFAPFVTDMYLPTLPSMTKYFQTSMSMVQLGLTGSMAGMALGQLFYGPLSDKYGRFRPLMISLVIFSISTILCLISPNIEFFLAMRFLQGTAAAGGIVIARSLATDKFSGKELAKSLAIVGAINGLAPVIAPVIGGLCADRFGWKGIFVILLMIGIAISVFCSFLKETLPTERRSQENIKSILKLFAQVLKNKQFNYYTLQTACIQGLLFGNIASSPFIIQEHFGKSPLVFSICFAINSMAIGIGAAMSVKFAKLENCIKASCIGTLAGTAIIAALLLSDCSLIAYETAVTISCFAMGLTFTASTALAMNAARDLAGTGSAIFGACSFFVGGLVAPLVGLGNMLIAAPTVFVISAILSAIFAYFAINTPQAAPEHAA